MMRIGRALGSFLTEDEARIAYTNARRKVYGEFAWQER
jgi:hypothetical protein